MTPASAAQIARFKQDVGPAAAAICPQFGLDPATCVEQAAAISGFGRYSIAWNYWNLKGPGDAGWVHVILALHDGGQANGGVTILREQRAKYTSPQVAVQAWCQAQGAA